MINIRGIKGKVNISSLENKPSASMVPCILDSVSF